MAIYTTVMFNSDSESASLADLNNGTSGTVGDFSPLRNGQLLKVIVQVDYTSASSLIEGIRIELTNTNWSPNTLMFLVSGDGLHTAPHFSGPRARAEYVVDQPVSQSSPIAGQLIHFTGTPVTSTVTVLGVFSG